MKEPNTPEEKRSQRGKKGRAYIIKSEDSVDRPKNTPSSGRTRKQSADPVENLTTILSQKVVGQPAATKVIVPYIQMFQAGLAPEGRPVGVFLLLGPTGTGKTKTVEALAEILHGSEKNVLKIDCGDAEDLSLVTAMALMDASVRCLNSPLAGASPSVSSSCHVRSSDSA